MINVVAAREAAVINAAASVAKKAAKSVSIAVVFVSYVSIKVVVANKNNLLIRPYGSFYICD